MVVFRDDDDIEDTFYKILLVLLKKESEIEAVVTTEWFCNPSGYSMKEKDDYKKLIKKLKDEGYIKNDNIDISIEISVIEKEYDLHKIFDKVKVNLNGIIELTEKGSKFMVEYPKRYR